MLCVLCEKDYKQGTCLCDDVNFRQEIEFGCCFILFSTVVLGKGDGAKASSHYFALFRTLKI